MIDRAALSLAMEDTWPPARSWRSGPATLRDGAGGGGRVSAATMDGPWSDADLARADLWRVRAGEERLDAALAARGLERRDPTGIWSARVEALAPEAPPRATGFAIWPPIAIMRAMWNDGGVGAARLAVMTRAEAPRAGLLIRAADHAAGVAFVAARGPVAMVHAIHVVPALRRRGAGRLALAHAAWWARGLGATHLALAVTDANAPAVALYAAAGMKRAEGYHYRAAP